MSPLPGQMETKISRPLENKSNISWSFWENVYVSKKKKKDVNSTYKSNAQRGARTHDPGIKSPMLYRLS